MLYDIRIGNITASRKVLIDFIKAQKDKDPTFTVVDVGGTAGGWTHDIADVIIDINPIDTGRYFKVNLNKFIEWKEVLDYVETHGMFSFAICSHTLEDIANPMVVMDMLPRIAKEGYIAVPSKYRELSRCEGRWLGYIHHRWIYNIRPEEPNVFVGYPKLNFLEYATELHKIGNGSDDIAELNFKWKNTISYRIVNDDYLGPSVYAVQEYYRSLL